MDRPNHKNMMSRLRAIVSRIIPKPKPVKNPPDLIEWCNPKSDVSPEYRKHRKIKNKMARESRRKNRGK